jgi:hypothetical protein
MVAKKISKIGVIWRIDYIARYGGIAAGGALPTGETAAMLPMSATTKMGRSAGC